MDLNLYFEPVALEKPDSSEVFDDAMFGRNIRINTANAPIDEISNYQVALLGVNEDRNSGNTGCGLAPDIIRGMLYRLYKVSEKTRIIDLGNLKRAATVQDTYYGLRDVLMELLNNQVTVIILGGTQDITVGAFMAFEQVRNRINVVAVDSRIDYMDNVVTGTSWIPEILKSKKLFKFTNVGHQQYLVSPKKLDFLLQQSFDAMRLGTVRSNLQLAEPLLRDAHLLSLDIASVKQSDAPATLMASPNGFMADEVCQLSRYAGLSDNLECFSIHEINPRYDINNQTAQLAAQITWYFIEGFSQRKIEKPSSQNPDFKVFIVNHQDMEHELTFYKSLVTDRWWMEVPDIQAGCSVFVACSQNEYQQACNHDIPDLWWKSFQTIN